MTPACSRRTFLKQATAAGAFAGFPSVVPSSVFGQNAPSNRIVMGAIGLGGMGNGNLGAFLGKTGVQVVAICDVDAKHRTGAVGRVNKQYKNTDCRGHSDFRELFAREKLDAVSIATPDHWHAILSIAAARAGCDIYGEKPLARSIREARAIANAVRRHGRVWQTGSWQRSNWNFWRGAELVRNGRIGKVLKVEVGLPNGRGDERPMPAPQSPPPELDFNVWLGPAPYRPFVPFSGRGSVHFDWRWIMDYSGGQLTDWAGHHIDIAHWGLGFDTTGPESVEGKGVYAARGLYDVPIEYTFTCTYKDGTELTVANAARQPRGMGTRWLGEKGWIYVNRGGVLEADPASILHEQIGPGEIHLYRSTDHHGNFLDCVRSRRLTITPVETALRSISVGLLGEIAMQTGRRIQWNPDAETIANDPSASALLGRPYREPWVL